MFCIKGVLRNFAKFTVKHQCQSLLFNKVAGVRLLLTFERCKKTVLLFCCSTSVVKFFQEKPVKEFIFSKLAGLQTATLLKNKLLHKYLSRAVTTEDGQLFCTNTSVWLLPLQAETHTKKLNSSAQLTSKPFNFNFATICVIHYASVWSKNFRTYFQIKTVTNQFYFYFDSWW